MLSGISLIQLCVTSFHGCSSISATCVKAPSPPGKCSDLPNDHGIRDANLTSLLSNASVLDFDIIETDLWLMNMYA